MIRVVCVDDHELVRYALRQAVASSTDMQLVGEAENGEEALELVARVAPHVVILDLNMPGMGGIETTRQLGEKHAHVKVLVVSAHVDEPYPSQALGAGALGYLGKNCGPAEVVKAIRQIQQGRVYVGSEIGAKLATRLIHKTSHSPFDPLSERELSVCLKITTGWSVGQIAELLHISPNSVSTYKRRVLEKLNVKNDVELTLLAVRHRLVGDRLDS